VVPVILVIDIDDEYDHDGDDCGDIDDDDN